MGHLGLVQKTAERTTTDCDRGHRAQKKEGENGGQPELGMARLRAATGCTHNLLLWHGQMDRHRPSPCELRPASANGCTSTRGQWPENCGVCRREGSRVPAQGPKWTSAGAQSTPRSDPSKRKSSLAGSLKAGAQ